MTRERERVDRLAAHHLREDPDTTHIFWSEHPEEVRLVEVTKSVESSEEAFAVRLPGAEDPSLVVILLSPDEWADVKRGKLALPWDVKTLQPVMTPDLPMRKRLRVEERLERIVGSLGCCPGDPDPCHLLAVAHVCLLARDLGLARPGSVFEAAEKELRSVPENDYIDYAERDVVF